MHFYAKTGHDFTMLKAGSLIWPSLMALFSKIVDVQSQALIFEHALITRLACLDLVLYAYDGMDQTNSSVWIVLLLRHEYHHVWLNKLYLFSSSQLYFFLGGWFLVMAFDVFDRSYGNSS